MARLPRSELQDDGIFHVGTTGVDKCTVYVDDADRQDWPWSATRYGWD